MNMHRDTKTKKKRKEERNKNIRIKGLNKRDKNHAITVFVRQVRGEQNELDSDKIVPAF